MSRITRRTLNNKGDKCKTYIYDSDNAIIFKKYTLITNDSFVFKPGGEIIIRQTDKYIFTFHWFAVKKQTLIEALAQFDLL